ncbi:MAG TPA: hypothetical protein VME22_26395 [Solirubrobacteraceae bacterium]|nr:hypothetical protein [Solirubrobacteraceae bacterium]
MSGHSLTAPVTATSTDPDTVTAAPGEVTIRGTVEVAACVAGALTIAACAIAAVVNVALAAAARRWLAYPFAGIPARPGEAAAIFLHNVRALTAVGGLLIVAQSPYWAGKMNGGPVHRAIRRAGEALLAAGVSANVIMVGASLGAYGSRMVRAVLPHGPIELAAYALALAVYIQGRHRPLPTSHALAIPAMSMSLLALAALLETFVNV